MTLAAISFLAGIFTVLAPCVLPILPVILGGSVINGSKSRPWIIILSFALSVLVFTFAIQRIFDQFGLMPEKIIMITAIILIALGVVYFFPSGWNWFIEKLGIVRVTQQAQAHVGSGVMGDILLGVLLGPVFNSCSPTYAFVLANILPRSFIEGIIPVLLYILGLCLMLGLIARIGRKVITQLKRAADPTGRFRKIIAIILIVVGVMILTKLDKEIETRLLDRGLSLDMTEREINQLPTQSQ